MTQRIVIALLAWALVLCVRPAQAQATDASAVVLIGGDVHFGDNYFFRHDGSEKSPGASARLDYDGSFVHLDRLLGLGSIKIVNLETPLSGPSANALSNKDYVHWTDPQRAVDALSKHGISAVGLANNHAYDQGREGLLSTLGLLSGRGIAAFGAGKSLEESRAPFLADLRFSGGERRKIAVFGMFEERKNYREEYQTYADADRPGIAPIDVQSFGDQVRALRLSEPNAYVIAYPHWGQNYRWASRSQIKLGRQLIEAGADMVVGHHGHNLQEIERYRGKWIFYGIGNMLFNAPGRFARRKEVLPFGLILELRFAANSNVPPVVRLHPIFSDNKITDYKPRPADANEAAEIMQVVRTRPASRGFAASLVSDANADAAIELADHP